jgi:protein TonB
MGHTLFSASLVPPPARAAAAFPISLGFHVAVVGALLAVPLATTAGDPPPVPVRAPALQMIAIALPPVSVAAPAPPVTKPGPRRGPRPPQRPLADAPATTPVPLTAEVPELTDADDDGAACVGCALTTGSGSDGGGAPGPPGEGPEAGGGAVDGPRVAGIHVSEPVKMRHVDPVYPELARSAGVQGTVVIECLIERDGRVARTRVIRSIPLLDAATLAAVARWRYRPTLVNGVAVPVLMTVTVNFKLR